MLIPSSLTRFAAFVLAFFSTLCRGLRCSWRSVASLPARVNPVGASVLTLLLIVGTSCVFSVGAATQDPSAGAWFDLGGTAAPQNTSLAIRHTNDDPTPTSNGCGGIQSTPNVTVAPSLPPPPSGQRKAAKGTATRGQNQIGSSPSLPTPTPTTSCGTSTPQPTATPAATSTSAPTDTPQPTSTPLPTDTPQPTSTPLPTATPVPTATPAPTSTPTPTATPYIPPISWNPLEKEIGFHPQEGNKADGTPATTITYEDGRQVYHYTWLEDGRMVAPVNQRDGSGPDEKLAVLGERVHCEMEVAHDWDTLTTPSEKRAEEDTPVTYTWTATAGSFVVGDLHTPTATGLSCVWEAPAQIENDDPITLTCALNDPPGARVSPPYVVGSHDDVEVRRTCVIRMVGASLSFLKVAPTPLPTVTPAPGHPSPRYVEAATPVATPMGGQVWATLTLRLPRYTILSSQKATMRVTELPDTTTDPDHPIEHPPISRLAPPGEDEPASRGTGGQTEDLIPGTGTLLDPWVGQDHVELPVDFTTATGWEREYDPDGSGPLEKDWWPAPEAPSQADTTQHGAAYRFRAPLDTTTQTTTNVTLDGVAHVSTLLGHNGAHELSLSSVEQVSNDKLKFNGNIEVLPQKKAATVGNLVITNVVSNADNADYLKFDPDADDSSPLKNPTVKFHITDRGDAHRYRWTLKVKDTRTATYIDAATIKGVGFGAGEVSVKINSDELLANDPEALPSTPNAMGQDTQLTAWGTYSFDIFVKEFSSDAAARADGDDFIDYQSLRSPYKLQIPATYPGVDPETGENVDLPGHDIFFESDGESYINVRAAYYLTDASNTDADSVRIDLLDTDLALLAFKDDLPTSVNTPHPDPATDEDAYLLHRFDSQSGVESGDLIGLFMGADNHRAEYREHQNHRMLAVNKRKPITPIEWIPGGSYHNSSWVGVWVKPWMMNSMSGIKTQLNAPISSTGDGDIDLPSTIQAVQNEMTSGTLRAGTTRAGINGILWGAVNTGGYTNLGFVGNGSSNWQGSFGGTNTGRYAFGTGQDTRTLSSSGETSLTVGGSTVYAPPPSFNNANPYGMSNLPALVMNQARVTSNNAYVGGGASGPYQRDNTYGFDRSIIGWTQSGNFYMIHSTGDSLFGASIAGWTWQHAGEFMTGIDNTVTIVDGPVIGSSVEQGLSNWMRDHMSNSYLNSQGRVSSQQYRPIIKEAFHLDGASHSSLVYIHTKRRLIAPSVAQLKANSEYHQDGWETNAGNYSMVKAYVR